MRRVHWKFIVYCDENKKTLTSSKSLTVGSNVLKYQTEDPTSGDYTVGRVNKSKKVPATRRAFSRLQVNWGSTQTRTQAFRIY